jgi:hypothetical protein
MGETPVWIWWGKTGSWSAARTDSTGRYSAGPSTSFEALTGWILRFEQGQPFELTRAVEVCTSCELPTHAVPGRPELPVCRCDEDPDDDDPSENA